MNRLAHLVLGAIIGATLAACGGGSNSVAEGGIGGTGISSGSISAFSSVVVNGTKFDVGSAPITVNGEPAVQSDLEVGYVVRIEGDLDDGVAESVHFDANLIGEVDANPIQAGETVGTLTVMQQTVRITATTVLEGVVSLDAIKDQANDNAPDRVLVSGFRDSNDVLVASHLEVDPAFPDQIIGRASNIQPTQFEIKGLVVISNEEPEPGDRVLVRGDYDPVDGDMPGSNTVTSVEDLFVAGAEVELEGIVSDYSALDPSSFKVDGISVDVSGATIVDETGTPAEDQIDNDVEVEVEGVFDASGVLVAERVEVELEDNVELVVEVVSKDPVARTLSFLDPGDSSGPRITARVIDKTELRDKSFRDDGVFTFDEIGATDWVELDGFEDGAGNVTALKIERFDPEFDQEFGVEGIVDETEPMGMPDILVILGAEFDTSTATSFDDGAGNMLTIGDLAPGDIVEVKWPDAAPFTPFQQPQPVTEVDLEEDRTPTP